MHEAAMPQQCARLAAEVGLGAFSLQRVTKTQQDSPCWSVPTMPACAYHSMFSQWLGSILLALLRQQCLCSKACPTLLQCRTTQGLPCSLQVERFGPAPRRLLFVKLLGCILKHLLCVPNCTSRLLAHLCTGRRRRASAAAIHTKRPHTHPHETRSSAEPQLQRQLRR